MASGTKHALFRLDGGPHIGAGHGVRCLALAEVLMAEGWRCSFAVNHGFETALAPLIGNKVELAEAKADKPWTIEDLTARWPDGVDLGIVDHYDLDHQFEQAFGAIAKTVLVIDDLMDRSHACDLLISPAPPAGVSAQETGAKRALLGPDAALLRQQFRDARALKLLSDPGSEGRLRVLVALGGTAQSELVGSIVQGLALLEKPFAVTIVGEAGAGLEELSPHLDVRRIAATADMAAALIEADIAIGACGGSAFERAALGLPSLAFVLVDNQRHVADLFSGAKAAIVMPQDARSAPADICDAIRPLVEDKKMRSQMGRVAACLCDGLGAPRAMLAIDPEQDKAGNPIRLDRAGDADCEILYRWQSDPETRRYANNPTVPDWREHQDWFDGRLRDPGTLLMIVHRAGDAAGMLRLDLIEHKGGPAYLVSIAVASEAKSQGIASAALRSAHRLLAGKRFIAEVDPSNAASKALFAGVGYERADERVFVFDTNPAQGTRATESAA